MNYSRQRELILKIVQSDMSHPTVDSVYQALRKEIPNVSLATVYRNLNLLAESGEICKIESLDSTAHFDFNTGKHYHFICIHCNKVYDIPCDIAPEVDKKAEELCGGKIISHDISFQGICHECLKLKKN
ncbi:MAG: transcriptional repressor [Alphaproteobacteria bacterium]|nr:transcriptional repressor [Alphaproteobacteria bacterium]